MYNLFFKTASVLLLALFIGTTACKKQDRTLGSSTYNSDLMLNSANTDTFALRTYTIEDDSVFSTYPTNVLLGKIHRQELGEYSAGFYTQVRLSGLNPNFGDISTIEIDSFILSLEYRGGNGYTGKQTIEVYELSDAIHRDSSYMTHQDIATKPDNWVLGSGLIEFDPKAITVVDGDTVATQLRIPLDPLRAKQLISDSQNNAYKSMFADNDQFSSQYLKGFYVKISDNEHPLSGKGMIGYFDIADADSRISIHYKENGSTKAPFFLVFNSECLRFNRFSYDNNATKLHALLTDSTHGQQEFYTVAGKYRGKIEFPTIKNLPNNIVIYSAQLLLPIQHNAISKFTYPPQIVLFQKSSLDKEYIATYDPTIKGYRANIQELIQSNIIGDLDDNSLLISPQAFVSAGEHIIFNGQQTDKKMKPKLVVSYTKF